jgi:CDP-diacylglycerol---serine O-phosphatidyltransferase
MFFTGVPAPAGAFLALFPIFVANAGFLTPASSAVLAAFLVPTVALLMISTLPTFSGKTVEPFSSARWLVLGMLAAVLGLYGVLMLPWSTFAVAALAYFLSLPLSLWRHREIIARS